MKTRPHERLVALVLALLVNLGLLGSIETLAGHPGVSPLWASAVTASRA